MELERWLTPERIANSDLAHVMFDGMRSGDWSPDEMQDVMLAALRTFGNGCCYFLASAIADVDGRTILGFWRLQGDDRLVHAVVVDQSDGHACDVLGRRPVSAIRDELRHAVGGVRLSVLPSIRDEMDDDEVEVLQDIAAGMPWMRAGRTPLSARNWARMVTGYSAARSGERPDSPQAS